MYNINIKKETTVLQVKSSSSATDALDEYLADMANIDVDDLYCSSAAVAAEPLLSDDIWKKFELDFPLGELANLDDIFGDLDAAIADSLSGTATDTSGLCEIRNHDCMWAGHCGSKEHPATERRPPTMMAMANAPPEKTTATSKQQQQQPTVAAGRSLLLNNKTVPSRSAVTTTTTTSAIPAAFPVLPSPESPPISDDEDTKYQATTTLQMLNDAIDECDIDEDSDLCEYFEEGEELVADPEEEDEDEEEEEREREKQKQQQQPAVRTSVHFTMANDHSYYKDKNATMRMANLGIETPSDSEEEIDVVSIGGEKQNVASVNHRTGGYAALPTNPSTRDRHQLQRTMASAITNKRISGGGGSKIKTLPPVRKSSSDEYNTPSGNHSSSSSSSTTTTTTIKKRLSTTESSRGVKRTKHHHHYCRTPSSSSSSSPYKRRGGGTTTSSTTTTTTQANSSDSEPESEKRNLHNNMERQRRIDLRNAFEDLRLLVPEVSSRERAAKVVILREASQYCDQLTLINDSMVRKVQELRKQQERLRGRVSQLRRNLAAKR